MSEIQQTPPPVPYDDEIDLRELLSALWAGKWLIGGVSVVATIAALVVALLLPNVYRSEALLAPNDQERAGGLSALAAQYGGLASLAGINLSGGQSDRTALGLEVLKSRKFVTGFVNRHDILVPLLAAEGWDSSTATLIIDEDDYDAVSAKWVRNVSPPKGSVPSSQEAYEEFMDILSVGQDTKTGFVTIAVEHYSPIVAQQWVTWLIDDLNALIMQQDVAEAEQAIEYLNEQIDNTPLADLQQVFFNLIEEQTKTVMLAEVSKEYLLKTLDPAIAPEKKAKPRRSLIIVIGALLGGLFGSIIHLVGVGTARARA